MRLGPFYFDTKEVVLFLSAIFVGIAYFLNWNIPFFETQTLLVLIVVMLITKGLLPGLHNESHFIIGVTALLLTFYLPLFQVLIFYFLSLILLKVFKII